MRDIELEPLPDDPAATPTPYIGDDAFARKPAGGINAAVGLTDPSFATDKAYIEPGVGGEFGPGRAKIVSAPADGGLSDMIDHTVVTATPAPAATAAYALAGRSANQATRLNLFPWFKTPKQGLDMNNVVGGSMLVAPEPASEPSEPDAHRTAARKPVTKHK